MEHIPNNLTDEQRELLAEKRLERMDEPQLAQELAIRALRQELE